MSFDVTTAMTNVNVSYADVADNTSLDYVIDNVTDMTSTTRSPATALTGLVDAATKDMVMEVVNCYLLPVVVALGVGGNVVSGVVLWIHGLHVSTNVLLLGLTTSDLCYLLTMYSRKVSCIVSKFDVAMGRRIETGLLPTVYMVNRIFGLTTPFLTMLITVERCLAVALPFKVGKLVTPMRMKVAVVCVFLLSAAAVTPFFLIYQVSWVTDSTGQLMPRLQGTPFYYDNYDAITAYNNIAITGIFYYGPMVIVIACTVFIITVVKRSAQWRKGTAAGGEKQDDDQRRVTTMLMTVVIIYICMYIPGGVVGIANQVSPDFGSLGGRYNNLFYLVAALQLLLYSLNSSCNFVIYMLFSDKFYNTYRRVFLCRGDEGARGTQPSGKSDQASSTKVAVVSSCNDSALVEEG